ncbi:uncharacterized protein LODBEIA_P33410 [Lodderomyces beijingensis]|uniref:DNA 3'-5' helicase n=1 Tax=Lodderomyces beijingensis TaxID=1775926 RepID=A0ABP0ZLU6_9ASCO
MPTHTTTDHAKLHATFHGLNTNQLQAATSPANGRLQIIAGPGTGKTKVLISRVAYLLLVEKIKPENIIVTTFTKKAANEMCERLEKLLGQDSGVEVSKLLIGTFHSICYRIIKRFGAKVGLGGFTIADERDKDHLMKEMLEKDLSTGDIQHLKSSLHSTAQFLVSGNANAKYHDVDVKNLKRHIGKLKAKGMLPDYYSNQRDSNKCLSLLYTAYQKKLQVEKKLDYDDCLLYCYILITKLPVLHNIRHVLVDEFQDTNEIQLQLMYEFAKGHISFPQYQHNVTIVGDPDQSIYAFREAQSKNFQAMQEHYSRHHEALACSAVSLTENYRSTFDILDFSERVMRQQEDRLVKNLNSQTQFSLKPIYVNLDSAKQEAEWIAHQIEFLMKLPQSPIRHDEIAILTRAAYQTRAIEAEFVKRKIPYIMVRGKAFWERKEVMAIMDYLKACGDENDRVSILRTLNYPKRGLGDVTLGVIDLHIQQARNTGKTVRDALRTIAGNNSRDKDMKFGPKVREKVCDYLKIIDKASLQLEKIGSGDVIDKQSIQSLFDQVYADSGLEKEFADEEERRLNVAEVRDQFCHFEPQENLFMADNEIQEEEDNIEDNFIVKFIESIGLYETDESEQEDQGKTKVSLSTIHGSKGLEWPVVFIPGLSENLLPAAFAMNSDDPNSIDEERRCFYVACTRAKTLLFISSYTEEANGEFWRKPVDKVSRFIKDFEKDGCLADSLRYLEKGDRLNQLYTLLGKTLGDVKKTDIQNLFKTYRANWSVNDLGSLVVNYKSKSKSKSQFDDWGSEYSVGFEESSQGVMWASDATGSFSSSNQKRSTSKHARGVTLSSASASGGINKAPKSNKAPAYIPNRNPTKKKFKSLHKRLLTDSTNR